MRLRDAFRQAHRDLGNFLEAEVLLKSCLGLERQGIYLNPDRGLTRYELNLLDEAIEKRKDRLPLAYITGKKEFYSLGFRVTPDTFIPRPETEFIVDAVLKIVYGLPTPTSVGVPAVYPSSEVEVLLLRRTGGKRSTVNSEAKGRAGKRLINMVDLGTGCGNIAITLARYIPHSRIYATDISKKALEVAEENARKHRVEDRITFLEGDLFSPLENYYLEGKIDFLISNPPYVMRSEINSLMPEVANYEPHIALDGGEDGLFFYGRIIEKAPLYLKPRGYLILELGIDQASQAKETVKKTLEFESIEVVKDYSQIERVIVARRAVISNQ